MIAVVMPLPYMGFLLSERGFVPPPGELATLLDLFPPDDHVHLSQISVAMINILGLG